jgi:hypothetical protein
LGGVNDSQLLLFTPTLPPFSFKYRNTVFMVLGFDGLSAGFQNTGNDGPFLWSEFPNRNGLHHGRLSFCNPMAATITSSSSRISYLRYQCLLSAKSGHSAEESLKECTGKKIFVTIYPLI